VCVCVYAQQYTPTQDLVEYAKTVNVKLFTHNDDPG